MKQPSTNRQASERALKWHSFFTSSFLFEAIFKLWWPLSCQYLQQIVNEVFQHWKGLKLLLEIGSKFKLLTCSFAFPLKDQRSLYSILTMQQLFGIPRQIEKFILKHKKYYTTCISVFEFCTCTSHPNLPAATGAITRSTSWLDLATLEASVQHYFQHSLAPSTQRTYNAAMKRFHTFCVTYNVLNPFPLTEYLFCSFAAYLTDQTLAPQTIKSHLSALRNMHLPRPPWSQRTVLFTTSQTGSGRDQYC